METFNTLNVRVWQVASGVPVPAKLPGNTAGCDGLLWVGKRKEAGTEGGEAQVGTTLWLALEDPGCCFQRSPPRPIEEPALRAACLHH